MFFNRILEILFFLGGRRGYRNVFLFSLEKKEDCDEIDFAENEIEHDDHNLVDHCE